MADPGDKIGENTVLKSGLMVLAEGESEIAIVVRNLTYVILFEPDENKSPVSNRKTISKERMDITISGKLNETSPTYWNHARIGNFSEGDLNLSLAIDSRATKNGFVRTVAYTFLLVPKVESGDTSL